ncbi:MAG: dTDP-4-dehydrorhamnose reductase [Planctomycetes bacterium]|nr:dTDP-4-dehydrorhamnose reductase [Planctomycetota bacterium]
MRILLLGSGGQVGHELRRSLALLGDVVALDHPAVDFGQPETVAGIVTSVSPAMIVNAAAYTAVDRAEEEPGLAHAVNAESVEVLARCAAAAGSLLVHLSTDYVYPGTGDRPWVESDPTGPLSTYGRTKLAGDDAIIRSGCRHVILRTSWVYASRGKNFVRTILRLAAERERLSVVDDQFGVPTAASFLADVSARVVERHKHEPGAPSGVFHAAPTGSTTWFGVAQAVLERARSRGVAFKLCQGGLTPCTTAEYPLPAARPRNSRLSVDRLQRVFGVRCPDWREDLNRIVDELTEGAST